MANTFTVTRASSPMAGGAGAPLRLALALSLACMLLAPACRATGPGASEGAASSSLGARSMLIKQNVDVAAAPPRKWRARRAGPSIDGVSSPHANSVHYTGQVLPIE